MKPFGQTWALAALLLTATVFIFFGIICLRELSSRDWILESIRGQIEAARKTYDVERGKLLANKDASTSISALVSLESDEQAVVRGLSELQKRVQILINVGAERISGTVRGMADIVEMLDYAEQIPDERLKDFVSKDWKRPETWTKAKAVDLIVSSTTYDKAPNSPSGGIFSMDQISSFWRLGKDFPRRLSSDTLLHFVSLSLGYLGACFAVFLSREQVEPTRLLVGAAFGLVAFFAIKGGKWIAVFDLQAQGNTYNHYTVAVLAFVAGLFQDKVRDALGTLVNIKPRV